MTHPNSLCLAILIGLGSSLGAQELKSADMGQCELESGEIIEDCRIGYRTAGQLDPERSNVVLFPTWFTGTTEDLAQFVGGPESLVDSSKYFVIMVDAFANGVSSSASNSSQQSGTPFPEVSIRDMVRHQHRLLTEKLDIDSIFAVVGISMGGMQAFEWAVAYPGFVDKVIPIAGSPRLAVYDIVLWETWLRLLELDRVCGCEEAAQALAGLETITSRSPQYHALMTGRDSLEAVRTKIKQRRLSEDQVSNWASQLRAMIKHNVASPYRDDMKIAAARVTSDMLVIVGEADHIVTPGPAMQFSRLVNAEVLELTSDCGHVATWCENERIARAIRDFLARKR